MRDSATARLDGQWPPHRARMPFADRARRSRQARSLLCPIDGARRSPRASGLPTPASATRAPASREADTSLWHTGKPALSRLHCQIAHVPRTKSPVSQRTHLTTYMLPRHTAVLELACSALGACSNRVRSSSAPLPWPWAERASTPLPACWTGLPACLANVLTAFALPSLAGPPFLSLLRPTASDCCHHIRVPNPTRGGRARGTSVSAPGSPACKSEVCVMCMSVDC